MVASTTRNGTAKAEKAEVIDEAEARAKKIAAKKKAEAAAAAEAAETKAKKAKAEAKPVETSDVSVEAQALAKQIRSTVYKQFKVALPTREQQQLKSLAYGAKDKLGRAIARMVAKSNRQMDWKLWNEKVFPALFGDLSNTEVKMKHSAEVIALAMARLFDGISEEAEQAIADLIAYNQESFNSRQKPETESDEELEDIDLEDDLDEDEDEDEDDLDSDEDEE